MLILEGHSRRAALWTSPQNTALIHSDVRSVLCIGYDPARAAADRLLRVTLLVYAKLLSCQAGHAHDDVDEDPEA